MFVVRCLGVSLAFFLLLYSVVSAMVMGGWSRVRRTASRWSARHVADLLCAMRGLPFVVAAVITVIFVVPSFLLLEPRVVAEPIGEIPLTLGAVCLLLFGIGFGNAVAAQVKTSRTVSGWLRGARSSSGCGSVPLYRIQASSPALTVAGVCGPRVLLSDAAATALSSSELEAALKHEIAHVQRHDNLKKLLFRLCVFPGMSKLEAAWSETSEMAADDAAVCSPREALDLASAMIKLSRFAPVQNAVLTTGLIQSLSSNLNARVARLLTWDESRVLSGRRLLPWYLAPALGGGVLCVVMTYSVALSRMHQLTEWLVR